MSLTLLERSQIDEFKHTLVTIVQETAKHEQQQFDMFLKALSLDETYAENLREATRASAQHILTIFDCQLINEAGTGEVIMEVAHYCLDAASIIESQKRYLWRELWARKVTLSRMPIESLYNDLALELDKTLQEFQRIAYAMNHCLVASRNAQLDLINLYRHETERTRALISAKK